MADQQPPVVPPSPPAGPPPVAAAGGKPSNRVAKLLLLAAIVVFGGIIWYVQREGPELPDRWLTGPNALSAAQDQAAKQRRYVLVLFTSKPRTEDDNDVIKRVLTTKKMNDALDRKNVLAVHLNNVDHAEIADTWKITTTPTLVLLNQYRVEEKRLVGRAYGDSHVYSEFLKGVEQEKK